jgi:predicted ATPase
LTGDGVSEIGWTSQAGRYSIKFCAADDGVIGIEEVFDPEPRPDGGLSSIAVKPSQRAGAFIGLRNSREGETYADYRAITQDLVDSRFVSLSVAALREDSLVVPRPELDSEGRGMAAVLGLWRGAALPEFEQLDDFLHRCVPELKQVLAQPAPEAGKQRLYFRRNDGETFDAQHTSDGVLCFTALAMHAIAAPKGVLVFIEEPEQAIHPRRLHDFVDLLRTIHRERGTQFVMATHSRVLLDNFRDEPEAVLLFRWSPEGTRVKRLADIPDLADALHRSPPGEMLESGFFNQPFDDEPSTKRS